MKLLYWGLLGIGVGILIYVLFCKYRQSQQFRKPRDIAPIAPEGFNGMPPGIWLTPEAVRDKVERVGEYRLNEHGQEEFYPAQMTKQEQEESEVETQEAEEVESQEDESDTEDVPEEPEEPKKSEVVPAEDIVEVNSEESGEHSS